MNTEAHLAAGWVLAHLGGAETRRFRAVVVVAALAPDLDVLAYAFGEHAYATYHHALGHNVFFSVLLSAASVTLFRAKPWKVLLFTQLAFYSHYFGDYFFTRFPLEYFWPVSNRGFVYSHRIGLDHPVNLFLGYGSFVLFAVYGILYQRTPMEFLSPQLDQRLVNLFRRKPLPCHVCSRGANERCSTCGQPVCIRHGKLTHGFRVVCSRCARAASMVTTSVE